MIKGNIYHYCSVDTFKKIIENRTFRFSDIMKSNDSAEIEFLWEKYFRYAKSKRKDLSKLGVDLSLLKQVKSELLSLVISLALCFSKKKDSLHMWNCYANEGISIGLNYDELIKWFRHIRGSERIIELKEVSYFDKKRVKSFVENECKIESEEKDGLSDVFF